MSFKEQLKDEILPKTVEYYNSGIGINEAIVKAAEDFKLNLDQTDRLLETMNTARVIAHYEKNAEDRTANCDIADKAVVRKLLYGDKPAEKSASAETGAVWGDYASYGFEEKNYRVKPSTEKTASEKEPAKKVSEFTVKQAADHVMDYARKVETERRFAEERVGMAKGLIATNLSKIAHALSRGYEPERRFAMFKVACSRSCPNVVKSVESEVHPQIRKEAAPYIRELNRANVIDSASVDKEITLARDVEEDIAKVAEMEAKVASCLKHENEVKALLRKYAAAVKVAAPSHGPPRRGGGSGGKSGGGSNSSGSGSGSGSGSDSGSKNSKSEASDPWFGSVKETVKAVGDAIPETPKSSQAIYDYLTGGNMTAETIDAALSKQKPKSTALKDYVNNMRRSAIITELYNDDPILSEANPEDITRAYETLVQMAPEASLNKEIVRAVLRQSVNSVAVSPFDAKQWADLDTSLLKNRGMETGKRL